MIMKPELAIKLPKTGHYVIAVSGGVDSVSLLHMLATQPDSNLRLRVAHVNHGLRADADSDERFVRELASAYALPFNSIKLELGQANEATARQLRYEFLLNLLAQHQARAIITAHHANDQLETSLLNTLRGSGRHGQAAQLNRSRMLRPLLGLQKSELYGYAKHHGLAWREDSTNQDRAIPRNFIRHELLGDVPDYSERHSDLMLAHQQINRRLDGRLSKLYYSFKTDTGVEMPRTWLGEVSWPLAEVFLHYVLRQLDSTREFSRTQIEELVRVAKTAPVGSQISLPGTLKLQVRYDTVAINVGAGLALAQPVMLLQPQTSLTFGRFQLSYGSYRDSTALNLILPPGEYVVRSARSGDRMQTSGGTKKIQDIFVNQKVPRDVRSSWPLIVSKAGHILWLPKLMIDPELIANTIGYQLIAEEL